MKELNKDHVMAEIESLNNELMVLANSLAGDETGHLAVALHTARSVISRVINELDSPSDPQPSVLELVELSPRTRQQLNLYTAVRDSWVAK